MQNTCRSCQKVIAFDALWARWIHVLSQSIYCDLSADKRAQPRLVESEARLMDGNR